MQGACFPAGQGWWRFIYWVIEVDAIRQKSHLPVATPMTAAPVAPMAQPPKPIPKPIAGAP
jgi:hypothetical protein